MTLPPVSMPHGDVSTWTQPLDTSLLAEHVTDCRCSNGTTRDKGQRLERLLCWLLPHVPGFRVHAVDMFSADHAQEIDLLLWNEQQAGGFPSFREKIIAECKNWTRPVDSSDVAWFDWKMRLGGVSEGILLAASGITGDPLRRSAAEGILAAANAEQRRILVVTLDEVAALTSRQDLRDLLIGKVLNLTARAGLP